MVGRYEQIYGCNPSVRWKSIRWLYFSKCYFAPYLKLPPSFPERGKQDRGTNLAQFFKSFYVPETNIIYLTNCC